MSFLRSPPQSSTTLTRHNTSAVDSHTAEQLIKECICGPLLANRTVILVTHHVDLVVGHCAYIVQLDDGSVAAQGTPEELRKQGLLTALREAVKDTQSTAGEVAPNPELATALPTEGGAKADDKTATKKLVDKEDKAQLSFTLFSITGCVVSDARSSIEVALLSRFTKSTSQPHLTGSSPLLSFCFLLVVSEI